MKEMNTPARHSHRLAARSDERGSATIIALLVLGLLTIFVTVALTRNTNEAMAMRNDAEEARAFYAAQASLESMTRNFNKAFEGKINPLQSDIAAIQSKPVNGFSEYNFTQIIQASATPTTTVISGGDFAGLNAIRDSWTLRSTATARVSGAQVELTRNFFNNRIPIFQFGMFYDGDLTLFNPPPFYFGGRVHTNKNFYVTPVGNPIYFDSRVSARGEIVTQVQSNGVAYADYGDKTYIKNASGAWVSLRYNMGSVLSGPDINNSDPNIPNGSLNSGWAAAKAQFDGNLIDRSAFLKLPIRIASGDSDTFGNIRIIKRGRQLPTGTTAAQGGDALSAGAPVTASTVDNQVVATERYYGKPGLRISLADFKDRLPGCAGNNPSLTAVTDTCGVRLDSVPGTADYDQQPNQNPIPSTADLGYQPLPMTGTPAYSTTKFNAYRTYHGPHSDFNYANNRRQTWIKVEIVELDAATGLPKATDITRDFLSLGVTEQAPTTTGKYTVSNQDHFRLLPAASPTPAANPFYQNGAVQDARDSRSVIKLQRWGIPGPAPNAAGTTAGDAARSTAVSGAYKWINSGAGWSVVTDLNTLVPNELAAYQNTAQAQISVNGATVITRKIVPFPIEMFDPREGIYNENISASTLYSTDKVPLNGVMSMVDLDIANLRRFLRGDFDGKFPASGTPFAAATGRGLRAADIPISNGWIVYLSDRRGDWSFNGDFDMEDLYGNSDGVLQINEDMNYNGSLDIGGVDSSSGQPRPYVWEGTKYTASGSWLNADTYQKMLYPSDPVGLDRFATANKDIAAFADHRHYRRGFRMINAQVLPGQTDLSNPGNTRGFTVAAEQAVYLLGDYNATGVASVGTPTPATNYLPQASAAGPTMGHVPASVAADQVAFLSNAWTDGNAWLNPFAATSRVASNTTYRTALLMGTPRERLDDGGPAQGYANLSYSTNGSNGGVHNFINMREDWNGRTLNYCGSLVSIFTTRNNTGGFKCCGKIYRPPTRNWTFDTSFLDPARIPPGTPMFQYLQVTGFQRTNN